MVVGEAVMWSKNVWLTDRETFKTLKRIYKIWTTIMPNGGGECQHNDGEMSYISSLESRVAMNT